MHRNFQTVCGCLKRANSAVAGLLASKPWLQWVFAFAALQLFFLVDRCVGLDALIEMYGTEDDQDSARVKVAVIAIGVAEDFVCAIYFVFFLWLADVGLSCIPARLTWLAKTLRFLWYFLLFLIFATPFVADILITRLRQMRFTFDLVTMALNEKGAASAVPISPEQLHEAYVTVGVTLAIALLFGVVGALWMNMTDWDPFARCVKWVERSKTTDDSDTEHNDLSDSTEADTDGEAAKRLEQGGADDANTAYADAKTPFPVSPTNLLTVFDHSNQTQTSKKHVTSHRERVKVWLKQVNWHRVAVYVTCAAVFLVLIPLVMLKIAQHGASPLYADAATNATLNELFGYFFHASFMPDLADGTIASAVTYLSVDTEQFKLVNDRSLVRTTTGFRGDLAFNVSVDPEDPPNVVVLVVESFRYHDSQYLVGNNTYLLKDQNITITPQFDRWAKRGIAFHNFWSSWRTSRSVESILFGQVPYDSVSDSGTTGGREDVKLSGMPQLFTSKGYSTMFTTGCILGYDGWDEFFGAHGFDTVLGSDDFKRLGEEELGIDPKDWALVSNGGKARAMRNWGVHDDVALEVLGNLLLNETAAQRERVESGQAKRPVFVNHYTISSHTPFYDRPQWYSDAKKPDFSALYKGEEHASDIRNYLEMRYFTDMAIGKFLDRMESEGVLNDTIVVISGDHGQAPEFGLDVPEKREMSVQRVAATLIAEGRLGEYAGMIMDDVAEQYDLLNTLADIVGVPDGGFVQDGVGRSLKRRLPEGKERLVYSNNPSRKLSIVRGHQRLRYDANSNAMELHNAETDHDMEHDLFPALDAAAKKQWRAWRDDGRRLNGYYKKRWDHECLLDATC